MNIEDFNKIQTVLATMTNDDVGKLFESAFDRLYPNAKHTSKEEDCYGHCDRILDDWRFDIKGVKKKKRQDKEFVSDMFMLEYAFVGIDEDGKKHYDEGWLHCKEMNRLAIGYITNKSFYFLIFDRDKLLKWCKKQGYDRVEKMEKRFKGKWEKPKYFKRDKIWCTWKYDLLLWIEDIPSKIDGFIEKIPIDDILQELLAEMGKINN